MKMNFRTHHLLVFVFCLLGLASLGKAETYTDTNLPGTSSTVSFVVDENTTNFSLVLPGNGNAYSHLLLRKGLPPTDTSYDFSSQFNRQTNALHLEAPEVSPGTYYARVRTPANATEHDFTLLLERNVPDMRSTNRPVSKPMGSDVAGRAGNGARQYFRVEFATNTAWQVRVSSTATYPDVYIQRAQLPTENSMLKNSANITNDYVSFSPNEGTPNAYYVGLFSRSGTPLVSYTMHLDPVIPVDLQWDDGLTHEGTKLYTNNTGMQGAYYFRISTLSTPLGGWRTALKVTEGEAHIYMKRGAWPGTTFADYRSERTGSDGMVLASGQFNPSEEWFILVNAGENAKWTLLTGTPYVLNLGEISPNNASSTGDIEMGPEGMRFFSSVSATNMLAWQLWVKGTNQITNTIMLKKTSLPIGGSWEMMQTRQLLAVPPYLAANQQYYIGIAGFPGQVFSLQNRHQPVQPLTYGSVITTNFSGYGYLSYLVNIPSNQVAWQITLNSASNGNANVVARRELVPNESYNDAISDQAGAIVDNITLVTPPPGQPGLANGTFFVTVYSSNTTAQVTLASGPAVITDIDFVTTITNDQPERVGWRYYRVSNFEQQFGLGWDLALTNFSPGTRIALRRTAAPGLWDYRTPFPMTAKYYDVLSTAAYLQRPGHQADAWYIGVYNPSNALGSFVLTTRKIQAQPLADMTPVRISNTPEGRWDYFSMNIPDDPNILGWDLRLTNVTAGMPQLVVTRGALPAENKSTLNANADNWLENQTWAPKADWTGRTLSADGTVNEEGRVLAIGMGRPLRPGTYYIGVLNRTNVDAQYTLISRWIGPGQAINVQSASWEKSTNTGTLGPREVAYYQVVLPPGLPNWKIQLTPEEGGEALLLVCSNALPNIETTQKKCQKPGKEFFLRLPPNKVASLSGGTNYIAVVSEGRSPQSDKHIGMGHVSYKLEIVGRQDPIPLGSVTDLNLVYEDTLLEAGDVRLFSFSSPPECRGVWINLLGRSGRPVMTARTGTQVPDPNLKAYSDSYGTEGGQYDGANESDFLLQSLENPPNVIVTVNGRKQGGNPPEDSSYQLIVEPIIPQPLAFDGGLAVESGVTSAKGKFYYITVPQDARGWDLRLNEPLQGEPKLIVKRGLNLPHENVGDQMMESRGAWPTGLQWQVSKDWTERTADSDGDYDIGRVFAAGMGRPLEPGIYCIRVYSSEESTMSFSIQSRGIGGPYSIPITPLAFSGDNASGTVGPREAAYYVVDIPNSTPSWKLRLTADMGEVMMALLHTTIPNSEALPSSIVVATNSPGRGVSKIGNEEFTLLPPPGQTYLLPGSYYIAVVGEGMDPSGASIGTGTSSYTIYTQGVNEAQDLGVISNNDTIVNASLEAGETAIYRFSIRSSALSFAAKLENVTGVPVMVMRAGNAPPDAGVQLGTTIPTDKYGTDGGVMQSNFVHNALITVANPRPEPYLLVIKARDFQPATYRLVLNASDATLVDFENGQITVTNQPAGEWNFFRVDVPAGVLGWDVRVASVTSGVPRIVVRRDSLPNGLTTTAGWNPQSATNWPANNQWAPAEDWTKRKWSPDENTDETGRILAVGMGHPLQPGTYYIGVLNAPNTTKAMSYTFLSRGIGPENTLRVQNLPFGTSITNIALAPREADYYQVVVPSNTPSWQVRLESPENMAGETMMVIMRHAIPNIASVAVNGTTAAGKGMQQLDNEHFLLLPSGTNVAIPAGTNYIAVISEGINPGPIGTSVPKPKIGVGNAGYAIHNLGPVPVTELGLLTSEDIVHSDSLEGGQVKMYQFKIPAGMYGFELRLENRDGNPFAVLTPGTSLPDPGSATPGFVVDPYGNEGGLVVTNGHGTLFTMANPVPGIWSIAIKARALSSSYPQASYTLRLTEMLIPLLNFSPDENTPWRTNYAIGVLENNERTFYRFHIPPTLNGEPVLGWRLNLLQESGSTWMRVRHNNLPSDADKNFIMPFTPEAVVVAPPFLTPGEWFVEIIGSNSPAAYVLSSTPVVLERPAWAMPLPGQASNLPDLPGHTFGTTTIDTNGVALTGDQSIFLNKGRLHYYAVDIPETNWGVFRVRLDSLAGNPDLYMRMDAIPTLFHNINGGPGTTYDRAMVTSTNTEYANWVPLDGRSECQLKPGRAFLAVYAAGTSSARYRLYLSSGSFTDMPIHGPLLTNQALYGGDWRYYRVEVPPVVPFTFNLTFTEDQPGSFQVYLRDAIPPGTGTNGTQVKDWVSDAKNSNTNRSFTAVGTYTFGMPPVRPGQAYYVGVRAIQDSVFSIGFTTNGVVGTEPENLPFYGGSTAAILPAYTEKLYRIDVPLEATRLKFQATHVSTVYLYMEQGTVPAKFTGGYDWRSLTANSGLNQPLVNWNTTLRQYEPNNWPWVAGHSYYLLVTNASSSAEDFTITFDGKNDLTEDEDNDQLMDVWERFFFGVITSQVQTNDYDRDGVRNLEEQLDGTDPTDPTDYYCRLQVTYEHGTVLQSMYSDRFPIGSEVILTPQAEEGYTFIRWGGDAIGNARPLRLIMNAPKQISALFKLKGDDFATALPLNGAAVTANASNVSMTKEPGEPDHAGNFGGKSIWWRWTAPQSGGVTISTRGSTFVTLLGVYTGPDVANLTTVASDHSSQGGTNRSLVNFTASAGTTYHIAVDGYDAASSYINLTLSMGTNTTPLVPIRCDPPQLLAAGTKGISIRADTNKTYVIEVSTNLLNWSVLGPVNTGPTGTANITDSGAGGHPARFYRARPQ